MHKQARRSQMNVPGEVNVINLVPLENRSLFATDERRQNHEALRGTSLKLLTVPLQLLGYRPHVLMLKIGLVLNNVHNRLLGTAPTYYGVGRIGCGLNVRLRKPLFELPLVRFERSFCEHACSPIAFSIIGCLLIINKSII
jgi:hypothetical protein